MKTLEEQLAEAQSFLDTIKLQIENKQKYPPEGTICEVWDNSEALTLAYSDGDGYFRDYKNTGSLFKVSSFKPLEMGLTFSDEIIHNEDITPEMDKQLVLCWDNMDIAEKRIRVVDGTSKCIYSHIGSKLGYAFTNYQLCTTHIGNLPQWARDMIENCKD